MKHQILIAATAVLLSLPLAVSAADETKKKGNFATADSNGDGKISQSEYVAAVKGKMDEAAAKAKFTELDKDKDGSLTQQEFNPGGGEKKGGKKKQTS